MKTFLCAATLLAACTDPTVDEGTTDQEVVSANGVSLNGVSLNGVSLNGVSLNGVSLNGVSLNGVSLNGVSLNGVSLNGVSLNGVSLNGTSLTGTRSDTGEALTLPVAGTTLVGMLSNGDTLALHVEGAAALTGANSDLTAYTITYDSDLGALPLCDGTNEAVAVAGTWSTLAGVPGGGAYTASNTSFTLACRFMTIAKCLELGYKPWQGYQPELESCVRLLRGDYCGDGTPYTVTGHQVNLFDDAGVQADAALWMPEAEWTPQGARCISYTAATRFSENGLSPTCLKGSTSLKSKSDCGSVGFTKGAVIISELPPITAKALKFVQSLAR
jgi:hypothetical protein